MAVFETWLKSDLQKPINVKQLPTTLFLGDNESNLIGVEILDGGSAATITGNVYGYVLREDDDTIIVQGTLEGNNAFIVLPATAYAITGNISIVIKVGGKTVGACVGRVYRSQSDTIAAPDNIIPSVEELLARIQDAEDAANAAEQSASDASDYAEAAEAAAETALSVENIREIAIVVNGNKQDNIDIDVGDYVVVRESTIPGINTGLYRAINSIPHGTTITSADLSSDGLEKGGFNALNSNFGWKLIPGTFTSSDTITVPDDWNEIRICASRTGEKSIIHEAYLFKDDLSKLTASNGDIRIPMTYNPIGGSAGSSTGDGCRVLYNINNNTIKVSYMAGYTSTVFGWAYYR